MRAAPLSKQRRPSAKCRAKPARTAAANFGKTKYPFFFVQIKVLCAGLPALRLSGRDSRLPNQRATPHRPCVAVKIPQQTNWQSPVQFPAPAMQISCSEKNRESPAGSSNRCVILRL